MAGGFRKGRGNGRVTPEPGGSTASEVSGTGIRRGWPGPGGSAATGKGGARGDLGPGGGTAGVGGKCCLCRGCGFYAPFILRVFVLQLVVLLLIFKYDPQDIRKDIIL
jgi:hypothetical protein